MFSLYPAIRPLLFELDSERAHDWSLTGLDLCHRWMGPLLPPSAPCAFEGPTTVAGLVFPNRIGLAAGLDKNAEHLDALGRFGFGFMEAGTVTPRPQPGNARPRMFRMQSADAIINRFGFNNLGLAQFIENLKASDWVRERRGILGLNIGKNASTPIDQATDDYLTCLEALYPWADYITINISSPNTQSLRGLQSAGSLTPLLHSLKTRQGLLTEQLKRRVPLFLKVAPDLTDEQIDEIALAVNRAQIEGLIATNTTLARDQVEGLAHADEAGGLSGRPLFHQANHVLKRFREALDPGIALIGVGGILSGADGLQKRAAGADLLQVYTGLIYRGPRLVCDLAKALAVAQPW